MGQAQVVSDQGTASSYLHQRHYGHGTSPRFRIAVTDRIIKHVELKISRETYIVTVQLAINTFVWIIQNIVFHTYIFLKPQAKLSLMMI